MVRWLLIGLVALGGPRAAESPVADAAQRGDLESVRELVRGGADVNAAQGDGMTALHWAAQRGDAAMAEVLVYAGADVEAGTRIGGYTPLHIAARESHPGVAALLLAHGGDPDARTTNSGASPLHLAALSGDPAILRSLLDAGAEVDAPEGAWGQTPLVFAAARNRSEAIRILLGAGADPNRPSRWVDVEEWADADRAAERRLGDFLDDLREKEGGGPDWQPTPSQVQAAIQASREIQRKWPDVPRPEDDAEATPANAEGNPTDDTEPAEQASAEGAPPEGVEGDPSAEEEPRAEEADDEEADEPRPMSYAQMVSRWGGLTPLLHAVRQGHVEATLALLEGGADVNTPSDGDGTTPLLMAALNGQFDLALTLLEKGADPNAAGVAGTTPLFATLERQWAPRASYAHPTEHQQQETTHLELLEALLEAGADPNPRLGAHLWYMEYTFGVLRGSGIHLEGATPFWRAAYALDVDAMRLLKAHGADPNIPTVKPPERRRRRPMPQEEEAESEPGEDPPPEEGEGEVNPEKANAEGESAHEEPPANQEASGEEDEEDREEEEDHSGVPPVPVGGPNLSPLHAAAGAGYGQSFAGNAHRHVPDNWLAAVRFLVEEAGIDVNLRDAAAYTALHHAASRGDNEVVRYLVDQGADVTVVSRRGQTTADMANGPVQRVPPYPETIALLVSLGAKNNGNCVSC